MSVTEHSEDREERRRAPRRGFLDDVYRELKYLAKEANVLAPGSGALRSDVVQGHQKRLEIALAFLPPGELPLTRALASSSPSQVVQPGRIEDAAAEIAEALRSA